MGDAWHAQRIRELATVQLTPIVRRELARHGMALVVDTLPVTDLFLRSTVRLSVDGQHVGCRDVETPSLEAAALSEEPMWRHHNACAYAAYGLISRWYEQRPETIAAAAGGVA